MCKRGRVLGSLAAGRASHLEAHSEAQLEKLEHSPPFSVPPPPRPGHQGHEEGSKAVVTHPDSRLGWIFCQIFFFFLSYQTGCLLRSDPKCNLEENQLAPIQARQTETMRGAAEGPRDPQEMLTSLQPVVWKHLVESASCERDCMDPSLLRT